MTLKDIEAKRAALKNDRLRHTEALIDRLRLSQQQQPTAVRELMLESLEFRREKLLGK